jgi:FG-GAP repeat
MPSNFGEIRYSMTRWGHLWPVGRCNSGSWNFSPWNPVLRVGCSVFPLTPMYAFSPLLALWFIIFFATPVVAQDAGGAVFKDMNLYGAVASESFGSEVAYLGDLDGDSIGDFLIGLPLFNKVGKTAVGAVQLISGADGSLISQLEGIGSYELFGSGLLGLPDIDGDLVPDFAISSQFGDGEVHLYSGQTRLLLRTLSAPIGAHGFGCALAVLEDVDANASVEILVGSDSAVVGGLAVGSVFMFDSVTGDQIQTVSGVAVGDSFGRALAPLADINSDGVQDYLVAAPGNDPGGLVDAGSVYVYSGQTGGLLLQIDGTGASRWMGSSLLGLEDINGDFIPDFAIGTVRDASGIGLFVGSVALHSGADGSLIRKYYGQDSFEQFGGCLGSMPDMDGDGVTDFLVGAAGDLYGGRVYIFSANVDGILSIVESEGFGDQFGSSAVSMGDFDGDGGYNILVGAPLADDSLTDVGGAYICDFRPGIVASTPSISDASGGTAIYDLAFPTEYINSPILQYQLLISASGTSSQNIFGLLIPLAPDSMFIDTLSHKYPSVVTTPTGILAPDGTGQFTIVIPSGAATSVVGNQYHLAVAWFETGSPGFVLHGVSKAVSLEITP